MEAIVPTTMKMAIFPIAVYLSMTYVFEASELWVKTTTLIACMPTGMAAYSMAERYQVNLTRAASTVLLGAIVSAFSLVFVASLLA